MFNLINTGSSAPEYINAVIGEVARVSAIAKEEGAKVKKRVSVKLVHEVIFVNGNIRSNAHLRYNTVVDLDNGKIDCDSITEVLEDGDKYSHNVINEVVEDCTGSIIEWIDMAAICGNELSSDDINHEFQLRLTTGLRSAGVYDHIGSSVITSCGAINSVIITVA